MSASGSPKPKQLYDFGPFRVDPEKEILLRDGEAVPLTPKTFQILLVLVRHSQQVVTKDDLMKAVWPDTFVEEANLSRNIFMLRKALGDGQENNRYVITVPGRGYRLANSVRIVPEQDVRIVATEHSTVQVEVKETKPWRWIAIAVGVIVVLAAVAWRFFAHRTVLSGRDTIVLADFANTTGDPVFDDTLRQGLAVQLGQSPFLSIISEESVRHTLSLMGRPPDSRLTPERAREVCERTASAAVLEGSVAPMGSQYILALRAEDCRTGKVLDDELAQASKKEDVLNSLTQMASQFRSRVGESLATLGKYDTPLAEATTPSLEALKAYSMGWKIAWAEGGDAGLTFFKRAVEIDPNFAMAYASLALMYGSTGESSLATESIRKAYELRDRASEKERFFILAYYDGRGTGNQEKAHQTCEAWVQTYPRDREPHTFLSGFVDLVLGKYDEAGKEAQKVVELEPDIGLGYFHLARLYIYVNRLDDAEDILRTAAGLKLAHPFLSLLRFELAFLKSDTAAMQREVAAAQGKPGIEDWISDWQASALAYSGHMQESGRWTERASNLAQQAGHRERAALFEIRSALWNAFAGNASTAKRTATSALALANNREVRYGAALVYAVSGDAAQAESLGNDLERDFPEDTSVRFYYLPEIRASVALNYGDPAKAIESLQVAIPYDLGMPRSATFADFGALYPVYVRGQAFLAAHQGAAAAREFQKIVDHRGITIGDALGALAHLGLARAYATQGDTVGALAAYNDFFTLWKDADPDISVFKKAQVEYAKLK